MVGNVLNHGQPAVTVDVDHPHNITIVVRRNHPVLIIVDKAVQISIAAYTERLAQRIADFLWVLIEFVIPFGCVAAQTVEIPPGADLFSCGQTPIGVTNECDHLVFRNLCVNLFPSSHRNPPTGI